MRSHNLVVSRLHCGVRCVKHISRDRRCFPVVFRGRLSVPHSFRPARVYVARCITSARLYFASKTSRLFVYRNKRVISLEKLTATAVSPRYTKTFRDPRMKKNIGGTTEQRATAATTRRARRNNFHSTRLFANCSRCTARVRPRARARDNDRRVSCWRRLWPICYHLARNALTRHKFSFHPIRQS